MASISLRNVVKRFGPLQTIYNVNLDIKEGEFVVFVGPSGCGKSTLLRLIAGLEEISEGEISIGDTVVNDVSPARRGVAMVFQSYALYPHMSVAENMSYALKVNRAPQEEIDTKVKAAATALQLEALLDRKPAQLSGGQRQRVAIGRAIVRDPKVFLFDEPLSNLDAELRVEMRLHIARLHQELKATMIYVTHDQVEAMTLADKIVVLRGGRVEQVGSPMELYFRPVNQFVAGFIGSPKMNFINASLVNQSADSIEIEIEQTKARITLPMQSRPAEVGAPLTLGIRPEHLSVREGTIPLSFDTEVVERLGNSTYIFGQCCGVDGFKVLTPGDYEARPYQNLTIYGEPHHFHLFDAEGNSLLAKPVENEAEALRRQA